MFKFIFLILAVNLTLINPVLADSKLPPVPQTGKPETERNPGGTRTGNISNNTCNPDKLNPVSLLAQDSVDFTTSEFPNFWFYLPYTEQEVKSLEFILKNPEEDKIIYRTFIELTNQPGITAIPLPIQPEYSLALARDYLWELIIYCQTNDTSNPDIKLEGWIRRVEMNTAESFNQPTYESYIEQDIFYDAVTQLAKLYYQNPDNQKYKNDWKNLLKLLGYQDLFEEPLVLDGLN